MSSPRPCPSEWNMSCGGVAVLLDPYPLFSKYSKVRTIISFPWTAPQAVSTAMSWAILTVLSRLVCSFVGFPLMNMRETSAESLEAFKWGKMSQNQLVGVQGTMSRIMRVTGSDAGGDNCVIRDRTELITKRFHRRTQAFRCQNFIFKNQFLFPIDRCIR